MSALMRRFRSLKNRVARRLYTSPGGIREQYPQYEIGRGTYGAPEISSWNEGATFKIGSFCSIANGVQIFLGGEHRMDWVSTFPFNVLWDSARHIKGHPKTKGDVIIGNDVWIGTDAVIMSGVRIGDGAVVGARALVARDVEPYAIHAGNPARLVRKRFDETTIQQLLELAWWDFEDEEIKQFLPLLLSPDVQALIAEATRIKNARAR